MADEILYLSPIRQRWDQIKAERHKKESIKVTKNKKIFLLVNLLIFVIIMGCRGKIESESNPTNPKNRRNAIEEPKDLSERPQNDKTKYKVTFIELGSVNCIPCKKMQPVMREIEEEYPEVNVIFYDVWRREDKPYAHQYKIRVIPTQVFLDEYGKEYFRHEGFFPKAEVEKILARGGVDIRGR